MRVCFDGLCFASKRPAVDEETQTVLCRGVLVDHIQLTASSVLSSNSTQPTNTTTSTSTSTLPSSVVRDPTVAEILKMQSSPNGNQPLVMSVTSSMEQLGLNNNNNPIASPQLPVEYQPVSLASPPYHFQPLQQSVNAAISDRLGSAFASDAGNMNLTPKEQELVQIIQLKNVRISDLENILRHKEVEVAELKSHLDKFQSVFPFSRGRKTGATAPAGQRQRAQGISAEPQSESSVLEFLHVTFPKYDKEEK